MNPELIERIPPGARAHVLAEYGRQQMVAGAAERGLELAIQAWRAGTGLEDLPGTPPALDAPMVDWLGYFIGQGMLAYHETLAAA